MLWNLVVWAAGAVLLAVYLHGRGQLARIAPTLAGRLRLVYFAAALAGWVEALAFPLAPLSQSQLLARTGQLVLVCMVAAPLFWLALPWHVMAWAMSVPFRNRLTKLCVRPSRLSPFLHALTSPIFVWFFYLSVVLIWHDPGFVEWEMAALVRQRLAVLVLAAAALLFWHQITCGGPRRYSRTPPMARFAMLVGVEIPNVIAGISIAFRTTPVYAWYATQPSVDPSAWQNAFSQQTLSGALTWVFGSLVYITSIILVVNEAFEREGFRRAPPANWDSDERFIAPGLEDRLNEVDFQRHDWDNA